MMKEIIELLATLISLASFIMLLAWHASKRDANLTAG